MALMEVITNGASKAGTVIDSAGVFLNYKGTYNTKATYLIIINRGGANPVLVNFNAGSKDVVAADNKTAVVPPGTAIKFDRELIEDASIFCDGADTSAVTWFVGREKYQNVV